MAAAAPPVTARTLWTLDRCGRRLWLDAHEPGSARPDTEFERDLRERGSLHKRRFAENVGGRIGPVWTPARPFAEAASETRRLLAETRAPLHRAALISPDGSRSSVPDFLYWEEQGLVVCDVRLARSVAGRALPALQMSHHARLLEESAGITPRRLEVVGGDGTVHPVERVEPAVLDRALAEAARLQHPATPEPGGLLAHSDCEECPYYARCWDRAERDGRLEVLPAVRRSHLPALAEAGITSLAALASGDPARLATLAGIGRSAHAMVHEAHAFLTGEARWFGEPRASPAPRVWLDVESDTADDAGGTRVYLWGLAVEATPGDLEFHAVSRIPEPDPDPAEEEHTWRDFLGVAAAVLARWPEAPWIHYSPHEKTCLASGASRFGDPDGTAAAVRERLTDLRARLMAAVRFPIRSYSMKAVARHLGFAWSEPDADGAWSVMQYRRARAARDPAERQRRFERIVAYNADDLRAMRVVHAAIEAAIEAATTARGLT